MNMHMRPTDDVSTVVRWTAPPRLLILKVGSEGLIAPHLRPRLAQSYQIPAKISPSYNR